MEILQIVWIFYVVFVALTFILLSYSVVKYRLIDQTNSLFLIVIIVPLSIFWPGTWLLILYRILYTKGQKDHEEGGEDEDY